jgi:hypothetical protein
MRIETKRIAAAIEELIRSPAPIAVGEGMRQIVDACSASYPHPDWAQLRTIDFDAAAARLREWFAPALESAASEEPIRGLFFQLYNPVGEDDWVSLDIDVVGTGTYDPADERMEWLSSGHAYPEFAAECAALDQIYSIAYGSIPLHAPVEVGLGNDAEWPLGLAFAILAARAVLMDRSSHDIEPKADLIGVAAGWVEGDIYLIGELTPNGFVPSAG